MKSHTATLSDWLLVSSEFAEENQQELFHTNPIRGKPVSKELPVLNSSLLLR